MYMQMLFLVNHWHHGQRKATREVLEESTMTIVQRVNCNKPITETSSDKSSDALAHDEQPWRQVGYESSPAWRRLLQKTNEAKKEKLSGYWATSH